MCYRTHLMIAEINMYFNFCCFTVLAYTISDELWAMALNDRVYIRFTSKSNVPAVARFVYDS